MGDVGRDSGRPASGVPSSRKRSIVASTAVASSPTITSAVIGVACLPGTMATTRMPHAPSSAATLWVKLKTAAFAAEYVWGPSLPRNPAIEDVEMITPAALWLHHSSRVLHAERDRSQKYRHREVVLVRVQLVDRSDRADDAGVVEHHIEPTEPLDGGSTRWPTSLSFVTSQCSKWASLPSEAATSFPVALMSAMTTRAPSLTKSRAVASPNPLAPP